MYYEFINKRVWFILDLVAFSASIDIIKENKKKLLWLEVTEGTNERL